MGRKFTEIAFTPTVKQLQLQHGTRDAYARMEQSDRENNRLEPRVADFVRDRDSFYLGSTSANGWPYIQFRGGVPGFLKVIDDRTLGFADFSGNGQYLSTANIQDDDRVFLFLMDYEQRRRLKIWGRARAIGLDDPLLAVLRDDRDPTPIERGFTIRVEAWDWNCPQHIPQKWGEAEVAAIVEPLQARIADLEAQLAAQPETRSGH